MGSPHKEELIMYRVMLPLFQKDLSRRTTQIQSYIAYKQSAIPIHSAQQFYNKNNNKVSIALNLIMVIVWEIGLQFKIPLAIKKLLYFDSMGWRIYVFKIG